MSEPASRRSRQPPCVLSEGKLSLPGAVKPQERWQEHEGKLDYCSCCAPAKPGVYISPLSEEVELKSEAQGP